MAQTLTSTLARGMASGVGGTVVMTAFQKLVEMPLTGRSESYAPAKLVMRLLPVRPRTPEKRRRLNNVTHYAIGTGWGAAAALAVRAGLRGQTAVAAVFVPLYVGDVILNTTLGLYKPADWSLEDWTVDVVDKLVQAEATGFLVERVGSGRS